MAVLVREPRRLPTCRRPKPVTYATLVVPGGPAPRPKHRRLSPWTVERVCEEYAPRVYQLACRLLANDADAEDVTQEVLLQVVRKLDTFRGEARLSTWLHRVTVNAALLHRRKAWRGAGGGFTPRATGHGPRPPAEPDDQALRREAQALIKQAIARLPRLYHDVFVLSDVEGLSNAEIGARLGMSLPAVKSRLHRGRRWLRDTLAPHFGPNRPPVAAPTRPVARWNAAR